MPLFVPQVDPSNFRICTSATRPTQPYPGLTIYEIDTMKILSWTGSAWELPYQFPRGVISHTTHDTGGATIVAEAQIGNTTAFDADPDRMYAFSVKGGVGSGGGNTGKFLLRVKVDGDVVASAYSGLCPSTGVFRPLTGTNIQSGFTAGSHTVQITCERLEGSGIGHVVVALDIFDLGVA